MRIHSGRMLAACAAAALTAAAVPFAPARTDAAENTLTIMCVGDSITDGYGTAGSYRKFLYHGLTEAGYDIEMVGDSSENGDYLSTYTAADGSSFQYDDDHSGHSGYTIQSYGGRSGIYEQLQSSGCLAKYQPDLVILQIGTNDAIDNHELDTAGERLTVLIEYILGELPAGASLLVTTIPDVQPNRDDVRTWFNNYRYSETWQEYSDEETAARVKAGFDRYNAVLSETVAGLEQQHDNLYLLHVNTVLTDLDAQLKDGVHPNDTGYALMGAYWTEQVLTYLNGGLQHSDGQSTGTTATTTTTTVTTTTTTVTTTTETTQQTVHLCGDVNQDGALGLADAVLLAQHLVCETKLTEAQMLAADLDESRSVNGKDLTLLKRILMQIYVLH